MSDTTQELEAQKINKSTTVLTNDHYNTPKTSLIIFHFEPRLFASLDARFQNCSVKHASIEGKDIYIFDDFFLQPEGQEIRNFSKKASFSRNSYGSPEAIAKGEKPARSMNGKERWQFFSNPPQAIGELYKVFSDLAQRMNADITTLPWELCDQRSNGSPAVVANLLEEASNESMELGKHQDCNPEEGIAFGIPILYSKEKEFHPNHFVNGEVGRPWLISVMLYCTAEDYLSEYSMGTAFYKNDSEIVLRTDCHNMRLVLFEGDIFHTIEESKIPTSIKTWRVSYVFKLVVNPRRRDESMKKMFFELANRLTPKFNRVVVGDNVRG